MGHKKLLQVLFLYIGSGALVGGVVGGVVFLLVVVLLCGFGAGMVAVYLLRQRKEKRQSRKTQTFICSLS